MQETRISPHFTAEKLKKPSLENELDVFEDCVVGWILEPARRLMADQSGWIPGLSLLMGYFEAIWTYRTGKPSSGKSSDFFGHGFKDVFCPGEDNADIAEVAQTFYKDARCGFFHDCFFRERIEIKKLEGTQHALHAHLKVGSTYLIQVDPLLFLRAVEKHFKSFVATLRDPSQGEARDRFRVQFQRARLA